MCNCCRLGAAGAGLVEEEGGGFEPLSRQCGGFSTPDDTRGRSPSLASETSVTSAAPLVPPGVGGAGRAAPGVLAAADDALTRVLRYSGRSVYHPAWRSAEGTE